MNTLSFDVEAGGFEWWNPEQQAFLGTTAAADQEWAYDLAIPAEVEAFKAQLAGSDVLIAHNAKYDIHMIRATLDFDILDLDVEVHDTELMSRVWLPEGSWNEHGGHGLKNLAKVFLDPNADVAEEELKQAAKDIGYRSLKSQNGVYREVYRAYPDVLRKYALLDARYTFDLYEYLLAESEKGTQGQQEIYALEQKCIPIFVRAEQHGTAVNSEKVTALYHNYKQRERNTLKMLTDEYAMPENALGGEGSESALIEFFLKQGVPLTERTDSGDQLSTSKFALQRFEDSHPVIGAFMEYRGIEKFLGTYIETMIGTEVVHPSFRQIGAWTGRSSCASPNMQNIPVRAGSEVREVFEARPGYKLVCCDYDSIEMRILAYYLGREGQPYRDLINSGHDPHAHMAATLYGGSPADYEKGTAGEAQRATAKNSLFAIVYGAGGRRLCDMNNLPTGPPLKADDWMVTNTQAQAGDPSYVQGRALAKQIKKNIPGYALLMQRIKKQIAREGYVTTILGRKQKVAAEKSYVGLSALVQGSAADVMKAGLVEIQASLPGDTRILLVVHDEVVVEAPEHIATRTLKVVTEAMERAHDLDPPLIVSGSINDNYGEGH